MNKKQSKKLILFDIDNTLISNISIQNLIISLIFDKMRVKIFNNKVSKQQLEKISNKHVLGIWSQGFVPIQMLKLKLAEISKYFDKNQIWISHNKIDLVKDINNQDFNKIVIVDDKDFYDLISKFKKISLVLATNFNNKTRL